MEELFFRGLFLKGLVRDLTQVGAAGGDRAAGVVLAVIVDGLLFGLAHGEWVQLAGLATFGTILAGLVPNGALGMNMVAHASFNLVAIIAIAANGTASSTHSGVGHPSGHPVGHKRHPAWWGAQQVWTRCGRPLWWGPESRMDKVFKAYDVRGTVPDQLDADMCLAIGRAMARFVGTPRSGRPRNA